MSRLFPLAMDRIQHLGLYAAFHRAPGNRFAHALCVPLIFFSATVLLAFVPLPFVPGPHSLAHVATVIGVALGLTLAFIDLAGAAWLTASLLAGCDLAGRIVGGTSHPWAIALAAIAVHLLAWYGTVVVGHERWEPSMETGTSREDSNVYFRRGYFIGRGVGLEVTALDRLVQFCIAPLSVVHEALATLGFRAALDAAVCAEREAVRSRLSRGECPLLPRATAATAPSDAIAEVAR